MSPEAQEKRKEYMRNYMRKWRAENREKEKLYEARSWEKLARNQSNDLEECRCKGCDRLLFRGRFVGRIEVKCKRCSTYNVNENNSEVLEAL